MRRCDEAIEVRQGRIGQGVAGLAEAPAHLAEGPSQFVWRDRLWRVLAVQDRWVESGPWWDSPQVRAARGQDPGGAYGAVDDAAGGVVEGTLAGLDCEHEVWRVEAACGQRFSRGVYELAQAGADGSWRLRAVLD